MFVNCTFFLICCIYKDTFEQELRSMLELFLNVVSATELLS